MKKRIIQLGVVIILSVVFAIICVAVSAPKITGVQLPAKLTLEKGSGSHMEIRYLYSDTVTEQQADKVTSALALFWSSSDSGTVYVSQSGELEALKAGTAVITVSDPQNNITASCEVEVTVAPSMLTAPTHLSFNLNKHQSKDLGAKLLPADATGVMLTYHSSDERVAVVSEDGMVTPVGIGSCTITTTVVNYENAEKVFGLTTETYVTVKTTL